MLKGGERANALVIHYTNNDCLLDPDDVSSQHSTFGTSDKGFKLVLMDAGCERHMYASDITRTFPASGSFTPPQRDLYEVVLSVQKELVKRCKVDEINMMELQRSC